MSFSVVNITIGSMDPHTMEGPAEEVSALTGVEISLYCSNSTQLEEDILSLSETCNAVRNADLVLVRCLMDPTRYPSFSRLEKALEEAKGTVMVFSASGDVSSMFRHLFNGADGEFALLNTYLSNRGAVNDRGILLWELRRRGLTDAEVPDPEMQRMDGIYHPDFPRDVTVEQYLPHLAEGRPTIGLLFVATHWIYGNLGHIDAVVRAAESQGLNIIPVFFNASKSNSLSDKSTGEIMRRYFTSGGQVIIDALVMNSPFSQSPDPSDPERNIYRTVTDVPVIQSMMINGKFSDYEDTKKPGYRREFMFQSSWAELDGQIISVPIAEVVKDESGRKTNVPLEERIDHILRLAGGWARLGRTPNSDKKVAIILYQSQPDLGAIGSAAGLDGPESAVNILKRLKSEGYTVDHVPEDGRHLVDELLANVTNNLDWTTPSQVRERAVARVGKNDYLEYYGKLSGFTKDMMEEKWGGPVGDVMAEDGKMIVPGVMNGNILITVQPLRAWMEHADSVIHDAELVMTHQYLGFYRWIQYGFGANAVIHLGTHGTLEWLPGKSCALSAKCCPDIVLNGIPNIYPFQMDDPGEGLQAKRRSEAVLVGYNCMPMMKAGTYGRTEELLGLVQEYLRTSNTISDERKSVLVSQVRDLCVGESLFEELGWDPEMSEGELLAKLPDLNDHLLEADSELVRNGLHVLGRVPEGSLLDDYIYTFTRLPYNGRPSLPDALSACGYEGDARELIGRFGEAGYSEQSCRDIVSGVCIPNDDLLSLLHYICTDLVDVLRRTSEECDAVVEALSGRYVMTGPSGAPTRSGPDILPSGRNYYGVDPSTIPSRSAWEIGKRNADQMMEKFREDRGHYPTKVGLIVWATDTLKTNGDDIAYALWLMGVRPVWKGESVTGLEVIPLSELGRSRVDVSVRITGLFRDTFPGLIDLLDDAVNLVSGLEETDEQNSIAASVRKEVAEALSQGIPLDEARRNASLRVFGSAPGTYGSGMNKSIDSSQWSDVSDLSNSYESWGCYAYGRDVSGRQMKVQFRKRFGSSQAIVKNLPDKEIGMVDMDDVYGYLGGLNAYVRGNGNAEVQAYVGDTSDTGSAKVRTASAALQLAFRSQVRNPCFIKGLMNHGYAGVREVNKITDYIFGWDATSDIVEKWMYDGFAESYLLDEEVYQWMRDENPYALTNVLRRLQEAIERGMWDADDDMRQKIMDLFIDVEERVEEVTDSKD